MNHSISLHSFHLAMKHFLTSSLFSMELYFRKHETLFILSSFIILPMISLFLLFIIVSVLMLPIACILELL